MHNNGIDLSIVNTGGHVNITGSTFDGNYVTDDKYPGGGGLYIEFPFCFTDDSMPFNDCSTNMSHYSIDTCYFANNAAKKLSLTLSVNNNLSYIYR